jgi:penicillin amidase
MTMDSPQAALYGHFWVRLLSNLYHDELGELAFLRGGGRNMWATLLLAQDPENSWWDDTATSEAESRDQILQRSFAEALATLSEQQGADRANWRWGKMHRVTFVNNPLGQSGIGPLEDIMNRGPFALSGSIETVNAANWNAAAADFSVASGTSERVIYDLNDWSQSQSMHTTGQSGHAFHPHYDDQIESWRSIALKPMLWTRDEIEAAAVDRLILNPAS